MTASKCVLPLIELAMPYLIAACNQCCIISSHALAPLPSPCEHSVLHGARELLMTSITDMFAVNISTPDLACVQACAGFNSKHAAV